jgi:hypothetical protein
MFESLERSDLVFEFKWFLERGSQDARDSAVQKAIIKAFNEKFNHLLKYSNHNLSAILKQRGRSSREFQIY